LGSLVLDFFFEVHYYILHVEQDVELLLVEEGKLSTDTMDWFRVWYSNQILDLHVTLANPYLWTMLKDWVQTSQNGESHASILQLCRTKVALKGCGSALIVPLVGYDHWSLAVMTEDVFLHFDSNSEGCIHSSGLIF
jgi:hypothetical protein